MSRDTLRSIQRAFREALADPAFRRIRMVRCQRASTRRRRGRRRTRAVRRPPRASRSALKSDEAGQRRGRSSSSNSPARCTACGSSRPLVRSPSIPRAPCTLWRATPTAALSNPVSNFPGATSMAPGQIENATSEIVTYTAPAEPCLVRLGVSARQGDTLCEAEALITVTDSFLPGGKVPLRRAAGTARLYPGTRARANSGVRVSTPSRTSSSSTAATATTSTPHAPRRSSCATWCDFTQRKWCRKISPACLPEQLLDRLIELSLYTEENLR